MGERLSQNLSKKKEFLFSLPPADLLRRLERMGEKFSRTEWVPVTKIVDEAMVVDEQHADDLYEIIKEAGWGQTQGVIARCRIGGKSMNDVVYDIADGFHRVHGIRKHGGPKAIVKIEALYNCKDEELYDQRIQAQTAMKGIKFARLATFMDGAWNSTPWKTQLSLAQAVKFTHNDTLGERLGLKANEAREIKEWVKKKAKLWMMSLVGLDNNLRTIRAVSPELIKRVRLGGSFEKGRLSLTLEQLRIFEANIPSEFEIQEKIAMFANNQSLSTIEISSLVAETAQSLDKNGDEFSDKQLQEILEKGKWKYQLVSYGNEEPRAYYLTQIKTALSRLEERVKYSQNVDQNFKDSMLNLISQMSKLINEKSRQNTRTP